MRNHVHLVLETTEKGGKLSEIMKGEMNGRVVYGSDDFIDKVTTQYKVGAVKKPIGRPKKDENK